MIAVSGLFVPIERLARPLQLIALGLPTTRAVALMEGIWDGAGWRLTSAAALIVVFGVCTGLSARVFRWG